MEKFVEYIDFIKKENSIKVTQEKIDRLTEILIEWNALTDDQQKIFEQRLQDQLLDPEWKIRHISAFMLDFLTIEPDNLPLYMVAKLQFKELQKLGPEIIELTYKLLGNFVEVWVNKRLLNCWYRVQDVSVIDVLLNRSDLHEEERTGLLIVKGKLTGDYVDQQIETFANHLIITPDSNLEVYDMELLNDINMALDKVYTLGAKFIEAVGSDLDSESRDKFV